MESFERVSPLMTPLLTLNASLLEHTSSSSYDVINQLAFASAYHQSDVAYILWLVTPPVLLVLGCYGNVMTILVMRSSSSESSAGSLSVYFTALAVSDLFFLCSIVWPWSEMAYHTPLTYFHDLTCSAPVFVASAATMTSAWCLVVMTCQRMLSIVVPHRVEIVCTPRRGRLAMAAVVAASCAVNLYSFFYIRLGIVEEGYLSCVSTDQSVVGVFSVLYSCLASAVPFVFLVVTNTVLIRGVVRSVNMFGKTATRERKDGRTSTGPGSMSSVSPMTVTLILTSAAFLALTLPSCIVFVYFEMIGYYQGEVVDGALRGRLALADTVCTMLSFGNSSVNFYIYVLSGRKFRQQAKRLMCLCFINGGKRPKYKL